jgi:glycine betaine/choline ABC-type transport system substrate-binding protein
MRIAVVLCISIFVVLSACSSPANRVVIGSKNFTEQVILGEMLAQEVERKTNLKVDRRLNLGGTLICHEAIVAGQLDMYVEYTGTALTAILKDPVNNDPAAVYQKVRDTYRDRFQVEWTEPLGFNNTFVMVIRGTDAERLSLKTISDATPHFAKWTAGFGYEFIERQDGFPGLVRTYKLPKSPPPKVMDLGLIYRALSSGQVDVVAGNSTDGLIESLKLFALDDDKHYFPPYDAVPLVRQATLQKHPELRQVLSGLGGKVSERDMRHLNLQVDGDHRDVKDVVREFLNSKGL